jgi:hypothetical protein
MDPSDGMCEDIMACGGDPTGTWDVRENCAETLVPIFAGTPGCEHVMAAASIEFEGAFGFHDGVATRNVSSTANFTATIDDPCAQALIGLPGITAADACLLINLEFMMNPDTTGTCSAVAEGCRCDGVQSEPATEQSDTYQIVGNQIVLDESGQAFDFCRDGDELHMHGVIDADQASGIEVTLLLDFSPP